MSGRGQFVAERGDFWLRNNWNLSSVCRKVYGTMMMTLALFSGGDGRRGSSRHILILPNVDTKQPGRLPQGLAISEKQWPDLKRSMAVFMMYMDNLSLNEACFRMGIQVKDLEDNRGEYADEKMDRFDAPKRDKQLCRRSFDRAQALREALDAWEEQNPLPAPPPQKVSNSLRDAEMALLELDEEADPECREPMAAETSGPSRVNNGFDHDMDTDEEEDVTDATPPSKKAKIMKNKKTK